MKTLFDIHMHILNLSHPNLTSYLFREDLIGTLIDKHVNFKAKFYLFSVAVLLPVVPLVVTAYLPVFAFVVVVLLVAVFLAAFAKKGLAKTINKVVNAGKPPPKETVGNCLSFFEIPLEYQLLVLEHFLKSGEPKVLNNQNQIEIDGAVYDKILLCPLVIDFGYKNIDDKISGYRLTPKRPIANQVGDLLYAIRTYYRFHLEIKNNKMELSSEIPDFEAHKHEKLFEVYPFMGLDTRNYSLDEVKHLLEKYFIHFSKTESGKERRKRLFDKMGKLDSNMYGKTIDYADVFAGIKLYPQLGFDPYPSNETDELEKVKYLYQFCVERRVPIVTHCNDGGFQTGNYDALTSPQEKWAKVLADYSELTLNFAHFGAESEAGKQQWRNAIIALSKQHPNVFTDISCNDMTPKYYDELESLFNPAGPNPQLHEKVLFGSDFSINLLGSNANSYNQYLKAFVEAKMSYKNDLCERNPEKFLFGGGE